MKRSFLLYFLISVMGILFIGRLFQLQIVKSRNYNPVKNSAVKVMFDFPERGYIYDRNGELLGIMSGIFTKESDTNVGVNFAISSELLNKTINHLIK